MRNGGGIPAAGHLQPCGALVPSSRVRGGQALGQLRCDGGQAIVGRLLQRFLGRAQRAGYVSGFAQVPEALRGAEIWQLERHAV